MMSGNDQWFKEETFGAFWEKGYRNRTVSCMGGPSFEVAEIFLALPENAKVLDLGCGEGRNAFFLASKGCDVTAVDRSKAGINKLCKIAIDNQVVLKGIVQDIVDFNFIEEYDLIMAHGVLYYLENAVWRDLLTKVKKHTRQGGFNIFTLFVYNENYPLVKEIESAQYKNSFRENELQEFYQDWIEHRYDKYVKWDAHPGIPLHYHPIEKLVSQRPLVKIKKEKLKVTAILPQEVFASITMEMSQKELEFKLGEPECIEKMHMEGMQFGIAKGNEKGFQSTVNGYNLELWFYGKHAFYMVNGEVAGKALYATEPIRLKIAED